MNVKIADSWKNILEEEFNKPYFLTLVEFIREEYQKYTVYPAGSKIFNAFEKCSFDETKVVIIGQDPYHGAGQAHGLCFSVADNVAIPPSLQNIFKEIKDDVNKPIPTTGNLERWATQGILMLNATLTVRANEAGSHQNKGWEKFTDAVIQQVSDKKEGVVFILWGKYAQDKGKIIDANKHFILKAGHPSPLNRSSNFRGCKHFSQTNNYLIAKGLTPIEW